MCDYSLHHVASRPAKVGDRLETTNFVGTITRGFAEPGAPNVAVCLLPGTEVAFEREVAYHPLAGLPEERTADKVARFRQVDKDKRNVHHDALEFPDGKVVLLTCFVEGQRATVLQLGLAEPLPEKAPTVIIAESVEPIAPPCDVTVHGQLEYAP